MYYSEYNLRQLLEIALRVPEVGAVNFNILYTILKAIIQKQGLEGVKPYFSIDVPLPAHTAGLKSKLNAAYIKRSYSDESLQPADSYRSDDISNVDKEDRDSEEMLKIHQKEEAFRWQILKLVKRMETFEDEITELHMLISQMVDKLSDMERITTLQDSSFTTQFNELREKLTAEESTKKNVEDIIPEIEDQFVSSLSPVVQEFHKKLEENYSEGNVLKEKVEQLSLGLDTIQEYVKNLDDKIGIEVELKIKKNVQELVSKEMDLGLKSVISDVEVLKVKHAQLDETFKKCVSDSAFMKDSFDTLTLKHEELIEQIQDIEKVDIQGPETDNLLRRLEELEEYVYSGSKYQTEMEGLAGMLSRFEFKSESEEILPLIFDKDESEEETGTIPGKVKADASKKHAAAELSEISEMKPAVKTAMEMFFKRKKKPEDDERESKGMKRTVKEKKDADKQALKDKEKKDSDEQALKFKERKYDDKQAGKIKEKKETDQQAGKIKEKKETDKQAGKIKEKKETDKQAEKIKGKKEADKEAMEIRGKKDTDKQAVEFKEKKIADKQKEAVELKQDEEIDDYDEIKVHDFKKEDGITKVEKSKEISKRKFQRALKKIGTVKCMRRLGEKEEGKEKLEDDQKEELEGTEKEEFVDVEEEEYEDVGEIKDYESSEEECETEEVKEDEYISTSEEDLDEDEHLYGLEKAKVKFKTAAYGVSLIGSLDKKKHKGKKARFKEFEIEEDEEQETEQYEEKSTQELFDEITNLKTREERSSSDESSEENFLCLPSPTVLSKDIFEEYILKMKHQIILYIKKHLQHSQDNANYKENEIPILKKKVDDLEKQMNIVNKRLNIKDSNSQIIEDDMNALKRITKNHLLDIMDIKHQLARKAEAYAVNKKVSFNELTAVEDRIMKLCLSTSTDVVALESKLENSNKILSEKLDKKISYEEFNIQLETMVRKLQELEKMFKAYSTPKIIQDFGDIRPIQVKHYIQGKESSRFLSACKRITSPDKVISELSDCYFQELVPSEIQKQVQKKMENATRRESTHYISGAHTKLQRKRN